MSTGHPSNHGYLRCPRCQSWRPTCAIAEGEGVCNDVAWCSSQASVGLGRLDADTGNGPGIAGNRSNSSERHQTQTGTRVDDSARSLYSKETLAEHDPDKDWHL